MIDSVGSFLHCQGVDDRALLPWLVLVRFYLRWISILFVGSWWQHDHECTCWEVQNLEQFETMSWGRVIRNDHVTERWRGINHVLFLIRPFIRFEMYIPLMTFLFIMTLRMKLFKIFTPASNKWPRRSLLHYEQPSNNQRRSTWKEGSLEMWHCNFGIFRKEDEQGPKPDTEKAPIPPADVHPGDNIIKAGINSKRIQIFKRNVSPHIYSM